MAPRKQGRRNAIARIRIVQNRLCLWLAPKRGSSVGLKLVCGDEAWSISLEIDQAICVLLAAQKQRADEAGRAELFAEVISRNFVSTLKRVLETDLRLPTETQVGLAILIARELDVPIPSEALRFRGAMEQHLSTYRRTYLGASHRRKAKASAWEFQL